MKKIIKYALLFCLFASLTACGPNIQNASYTLESEENGVRIVDTLSLEAEGDVVQHLQEVIEADISGFDEETQETLYAVYDDLVASYAAVEGVECTGEALEGIYTIQISIDTTGVAVEELSEQGLLEVEGDSEGISFEKTIASLVSQGYEAVKTE